MGGETCGKGYRYYSGKLRVKCAMDHNRGYNTGMVERKETCNGYGSDVVIDTSIVTVTHREEVETC